jgi:myo-inositol-1-phosphate synthase
MGKKIQQKRIPVVGDDVKSQIGLRLSKKSRKTVSRPRVSDRQNISADNGGIRFSDMLNRKRLVSKRAPRKSSAIYA